MKKYFLPASKNHERSQSHMIKSFERIKKQNKERINVPRTIQDTIPIDTIYKDGIFRIGNKYSKSYRFLDINYKIASGEDKNNLFLS